MTRLHQIEVVNSLSLLTAKPVTYLVNLSEKDYIRKKNKWSVGACFRSSIYISDCLSDRLPKIKAWIDENNTGDPLIPFSVALEDRLSQMDTQEEKDEEQKKIGAQSALAKITHAGYASLDVRTFQSDASDVSHFNLSSFGTSPPVQTKCAHGQSVRGPKRLKQLVSSSE